MKLHYQTQGQGPLLVLLHGWGFSHSVWQNLIPPLAQHYTVMSFDLPGFGQSPFDSNINSLASFSEAVLKNIPTDAIVMGWSLGGIVAQYLAIHYPQKITQLIAVASTPCFVKQDQWPGVNAELLKSFADELLDNYPKIMQRFINLQFFGTEIDRELVKNLQQQIIQTPPSPAALRLGLELLLKADLRSELHKIQGSIRFILGKLDVLVPLSLSKVLQSLNQKIRIEIINGAGHAAFISHPAAFLATTGLLP